MFSLRQITNKLKRFVPISRQLASQARPLTDLKVDNDGIATLTMQRLPVNSLNLDLLQDLSKSLDEVAKDKAKAMILLSASPTVFSAGLDIMELYKPDLKRVETFWITLQDVWLKLFGSSFITAAAIYGHAPAAGCLLAMSCDYRTMVTGKFTIGPNEAALGLVAPSWYIDTVCHAVHIRHVERAFTLGKLFTAEEALKVGLIDATASGKNDAIANCKAFIRTFDNISHDAYSTTKLKFREGPLRRFQENRKQDIQQFLEFIQKPEVQQNLEMYLQAMKKRAAEAGNGRTNIVS